MFKLIRRREGRQKQSPQDARRQENRRVRHVTRQELSERRKQNGG